MSARAVVGARFHSRNKHDESAAACEGGSRLRAGGGDTLRVFFSLPRSCRISPESVSCAVTALLLSIFHSYSYYFYHHIFFAGNKLSRLHLVLLTNQLSLFPSISSRAGAGGRGRCPKAADPFRTHGDGVGGRCCSALSLVALRARERGSLAPGPRGEGRRPRSLKEAGGGAKDGGGGGKG